MEKIHRANQKDLLLSASPRKSHSSKYDNKTVVIIGGSSLFHGAPALSSLSAYQTLAALRIGTGYALTYVPKGILREVRSVSPNIIVRPFGGNDLSVSDLKSLKIAISKADSVVLGPGLGRKKQSLLATGKLLKYLLNLDKKVVVDADALLAAKGLKLNKNFVITPNEKEFLHLYKRQLKKNDLKSRADAAIGLARKINSIVVLKGHETVVTDGKMIKVIYSKSSSLATMGTGDILAGIIGGYAALTGDTFASSVAGAYLHSQIGEQLGKKMGNHMLASDMVQEIPKIIKRFDKNVK